MKYTNKYKLGYFEKGDITTADIEMQRFETLDVQLYSLFQILGNGIINGWNITPSSGLGIAISPGSGHVAFVSVKSTANYIIQNLTPNSNNYIYAQLTTDSYWNQTVEFSAYVSSIDDDQSLLIGVVTTNDTGIDITAPYAGIDVSARKELGFIGLIKQAVANHRHIGGVDNPPPINLDFEVQGILNQNNLPDLDASIIKSGILDEDRIPVLSHISNLKDQGTLTHAQLESIIENLTISSQGNMGEIALINLLQLVLGLKHIYPSIDDFLVNCISIIPGISPDSYIDFVNTTATVDTRTYAEGGEHTISGSPSGSIKLYTKIWDTKDDYESGTKSNVILDGNSVVLDTSNNSLVIDNFSSIGNWSVITEDSSALSASISIDSSISVSSPRSARISVNGNEIEMMLLAKKEFSPQNWSDYNYLKFFIHTTSVEHGDIFFYFRDGNFGVQNSYVKILDRNTPTINQDTLQNGWQEVVVDISRYNRSSVNFFSFMLSTQDGWDSSKSFIFNIDDFSLSTSNTFKSNGYIRLIYGNNFPYNFNALRWDAYLPTGTFLKARARFANTVANLTNAIWTDYINNSGDSFGLLATEYYKYIEIELFLQSSPSQLFSPYLNTVFLDYYANDVINNTKIDSQNEWEQGNNFNIDTKTSPGSIKVGSLNDIGKYQYSSEGQVSILNSNLSEQTSIFGSALPRTTNQCLNNLSAQFGLITAIENGDNGNIWLADADNDRVIEIDKSGNLVRGFYGSFLRTPLDVYGKEDSGPGSNIYVSVKFPEEPGSETEISNQNQSTNSTNETNETKENEFSLSVLHSVYNPDKGILYIVFNKNLENIYGESNFSLNNCFLKIANHVYRMNGGKVSLMGMPQDKYDVWSALYNNKNQRETKNGENIRQFKFFSHVLEIQMNQAEQITLNKMVRTNNPKVSIAYPSNNDICNSNFTAEFNFYNFNIGNGAEDSSAIVTIDNTTTYTIYSNSLNISGLSNGPHNIKIKLYDSNQNEIVNIGSNASVDFIVNSGEILEPILKIKSPKSNQIFSTNLVEIAIETQNFPIIPSGQHLRYQIDNDPIQDYYSTNPIKIDNLNSGQHTFVAYLVDDKGQDLNYKYGRSSVNFIIGLNPDAIVNLNLEQNFIRDITKKYTNLKTKIPVDVANIIFSNIFCPVDLQIINYNTSKNTAKLPSLLISKLRSPTWLNYLSDKQYANEYANRILKSTNTNQSLNITLDPALKSIETRNLVFGNKFMDGHSVIQLDLDGNIFLSNNAAVFATSKTEAKNILGSAKKIGQNELLIGDSKNQRAILCYIDLFNQTSKITWQYDSDRYVVDFIKYPDPDPIITINNGYIDITEQFVVRGSSVIWKNNSNAPVEIYSGNTTYEALYSNNNLFEYGTYFKSGIINPGDSYAFRFEINGEFDWFVYPSVIRGKIIVTEQRISPRDMFYILESDGLESPYTSRAIKVDSWGNILWSFGDNYLVKPRDIRALANNKVIIST